MKILRLILVALLLACCTAGSPYTNPPAGGGGGGAPTTAKYWTSEASGDLSAEVNLGALTTGLLKHTVAAGVSTPATATAADLPSGIDATKIADGSVTDTEFQYIGTLTSDAQSQLNTLDTGKVDVVMSALGDVMYGGADGAETKLVGNTTTTPKVLMQTGDGAASAAPAWTAAGTSAETMAAGNDSRFGYLITGHQASQNPSDSTTYYFGANFNANLDTNGDGRYGVPIPFTGTVTKIVITTRAGTASGAEAELSTLNFRYDNTSDTLITNALSYVSTARQIITANVSVAVTAGHYFEFKLATPAWATNPTAVWFNYQVFVQVP